MMSEVSRIQHDHPGEQERQAEHERGHPVDEDGTHEEAEEGQCGEGLGDCHGMPETKNTLGATRLPRLSLLRVRTFVIIW